MTKYITALKKISKMEHSYECLCFEKCICHVGIAKNALEPNKKRTKKTRHFLHRDGVTFCDGSPDI